ncbi:hypothetical protein WMZ97_05585 [Lentibacillus sp. N15]|uniref:hypothetical protein n=1 Tax=Lentibacillus songyuanensis TaxID=3136161 RepID=UPI0031BBA91B
MRCFLRAWKQLLLKRYVMFPLIIGYLTFLTISLMATPTTAYFTDSASVNEKLTMADHFAGEEQEEPTDTKKPDNQETQTSDTDKSEQKQASGHDKQNEKVDGVNPLPDETSSNEEKGKQEEQTADSAVVKSSKEDAPPSSTESPEQDASGKTGSAS